MSLPYDVCTISDQPRNLIVQFKVPHLSMQNFYVCQKKDFHKNKTLLFNEKIYFFVFVSFLLQTF